MLEALMPFHVEAFNTVARSALLKIGNLKTGPFYFSTLNIKAESFTINRAPLAQWIEHRPSKPKVVGSSPTGRAIFQEFGKSRGSFPKLTQGGTLLKVMDANPDRGYIPAFTNPHFIYAQEKK